MHPLIVSFEEFRNIVPHPIAYRVGGEVFPRVVPETDVREVVEQARTHPKVRIATGERGDRLSASLRDFTGDFRALPIEEAVKAPVHLSIFELESLSEPGGALHEVIESVYHPVTQLWAERGLTWGKVYPILFLSGPGCSTNYHWDPSSVLIVQLHGRKRYHSLRDPLKWCPEEVIAQGHDAMIRPDGLTEADILTFELAPGDALWSPCHQPHWVDAYDETAYTLSIAFTNISAQPSV